MVLQVVACQTRRMTGATGVLIRLGVSLVVFTAIFWVAARRDPKIKIEKKWVTPLVGVVFALMNFALYWALTPILNLATLGAIGFIMPMIVNLILLGLTMRIFEAKKWFVVEGFLPMIKLALYLTLAHGALWVALDYLPNR
jgi:hypothetical protein